MNREEKLEMLGKPEEKKLTTDILIPLFERMGFKNITYRHGVLECGRDIIYCEETKFLKHKYIGVQVKSGDVDTKIAENLFNQVTRGIGGLFKDLSDKNKEKAIDEFIILCSGKIKENARQNISNMLNAINVNKPVSFIAGEDLVGLLDEYMPSAFWDEYNYFNRYFNAMKADFTTIKDISAIGQKETISLEEIYVSLRLIEESSEQEMAEVREEGSNTFEDVFARKEEREQRNRIEEMKKVIDAEEALGICGNLVIIGDPGSGKTTLTRYFALKACKENLKKQERIIVPIPVTLRELEESGKSLRAYIDKVFEKYDFPKAKKFIEKELNDGRCRLLLDGFDELAAKESQKKIAGKISKFGKKYRKTKIVLTSRPAGYHDELEGFTKVELMCFDDRQVETFINNWFGAREPEKAKSMFEAIKKKDRIKALARNPLMIAIIAIIYEEDRKLPQRRADLYERCVEVLLSKWDVQKRIKNKYPTDKKEFILQKIAFFGHSNKKRVLTEGELKSVMLKYFPQLRLKSGDFKSFLNEIWQRSYLLRQISMNSYDFLHLSFQEYFTALELKEREDGLSTIIQHLDEPWWEEPILLYAGISRDSSILINKIEEARPEDIFRSNLMLVGKCVADAQFTEVLLSRRIVYELWYVYRNDKSKSLRQRAIRIIRLIQPNDIISSLVKDLEQTKDKDSSVQARAAYALGSIGNYTSIKPLVRALTPDKERNVRGSAAHALGRIGSEKAIDPLVKVLKNDKERNVRGSAAYALGRIGGDKAIEPLIKALMNDKEKNVRGSAAWALGRIGSEKAIKALVKSLTNDKEGNVRGSAAYVLGSLGSYEAIEPLVKTITYDKEKKVRDSAAYALSCTRSEKAIETLVKILTTKKEKNLRGSAAYALGRIGSQEAIEPLVTSLMNDKEENVRGSAAYALGRVGSEKAIEPLIKALMNDKEQNVRGSAAYSLGCIGNEKAIEPLIKALTTDKEENVRVSAAYALRYIENEKAIEPLVKVLKNDKGNRVRGSAAWALGRIGCEKAIKALAKSLTNDKEENVRGSAAWALGIMESEKAIKALAKSLTNDKEKNVRGSAAYALGRIGGDKAIEPLIKALMNDKEQNVRGSAAYSLGCIGREKVVVPLIKSLMTDKYDNVRGSTAYALGHIGSEQAVEPLIKTLINDKVNRVRGSAAWALGCIGSEKAITPLKQALEDEGEYSKVKVKDTAFAALEKISRSNSIRITRS